MGGNEPVERPISPSLPPRYLTLKTCQHLKRKKSKTVPQKPNPIDIASWAVKLLRFENFHCDDESQFFDAFHRAYRASEHFIAEFKALEKTTCPRLYDQP
jgi:hypothetical protein